MGIFEKYININTEEYLIETSQSKKDGRWFTDKVRVTGATEKEVEDRLTRGMNVANRTTNAFNKEKQVKKKGSENSPPSQKVKM